MIPSSKKSLGLTIAIAVLTPVACSMLLGCTCLQTFLRPSKQPASIEAVENESSNSKPLRR